ncbi:MAG: DNA polymerase III subunit beta [Actinomycetia bacterium]|nr:DNA polymerase III subunit beta [Actinomycetes bacterium]
MKLTIEKNQLVNALTAVSKGMSSRSTMIILSGVLLIAADNKLTLRTTDLEISIQNQVDALVDQEGESVVPGKLLLDVVKSLPEAAINLESDNQSLQVSCEGSTFDISTMNPLDYPGFPKVDIIKSVTLRQKDLSSMVHKVLKAVSRDESRSILMGILTKLKDGELTMVATDSYRLATVERKIDNDSELEIIVPGTVFDEICRLSTADEEISVSDSENQLMFSFGSTIFVSRKIEGNFPNYETLIPADHSVRAVINTADLLTSVRRVSIAGQNRNPIRLEFDPAAQRVSVSSKTQDIASAIEVIDAQIEGERLEIGFNNQYITDGLSVVGKDELVFEGQSALKAGVLKTSDDEDFLYLTMPVRIDS